MSRSWTGDPARRRGRTIRLPALVPYPVLSEPGSAFGHETRHDGENRTACGVAARRYAGKFFHHRHRHCNRMFDDVDRHDASKSLANDHRW